tara:strand:+ start:725 stop:1375 length:651 start_codon:yes stop_codon:yes gene_type:complete
MAISVIGAGWGRTGTLTMKYALETLGYLKCHHMAEVINNPGEDQRWLAAYEGEATNWNDFLADYQATVDWPSCHFYKELADYYPEAKVILTVRDPETWYESARETIFRVIKQGIKNRKVETKSNLGYQLVIKAALNGDTSKENAIRKFKAHIETVKQNIDPARLLMFEVKNGWEPLCSFLEKRIPDEPFPKINTRDEFEGIFFGNRLSEENNNTSK